MGDELSATRDSKSILAQGRRGDWLGRAILRLCLARFFQRGRQAAHSTTAGRAFYVALELVLNVVVLRNQSCSDPERRNSIMINKKNR
jgi:hypothetical protein